MFSVLGQYILPRAREAEKSDTHQYIRKHERDQNSKKKKSKDSNDPFDMEDKASVSVDALYSYLTSILGDESSTVEFEENTLIDEKDRKNRDILEEAAFITFERRKNSSQNAKAANAYAHAAETSPKSDMRQNKRNFSEESTLINPEDRSFLEDLLNDLRILQNNQIREIEIERAETFLKSLRNSIEKRKNQISSL